MCLTIWLKSALRAALKTGKIYKQTWYIHDPTIYLQAGDRMPGTVGDFAEYVLPLFDRDWARFQVKEREFREIMDTKLLDDKQRIAFTGKDPTCWIKLFSILNGLYYKHGTFSASHRDGRPFGTPLLKYTAQILKKLPVRT